MPFSELHNFPRHFKPRKDGILAWRTCNQDWTQEPRKQGSLIVASALRVPIISFLTAQQRRLRRTHLKDYPQELSHIFSQMIMYKNSPLPGAYDCSLRQEFVLENKINTAPRAIPKRIIRQLFLECPIFSGESAKNKSK